MPRTRQHTESLQTKVQNQCSCTRTSECVAHMMPVLRGPKSREATRYFSQVLNGFNTQWLTYSSHYRVEMGVRLFQGVHCQMLAIRSPPWSHPNPTTMASRHHGLANLGDSDGLSLIHRVRREYVNLSLSLRLKSRRGQITIILVRM